MAVHCAESHAQSACTAFRKVTLYAFLPIPNAPTAFTYLARKIGCPIMFDARVVESIISWRQERSTLHPRLIQHHQAWSMDEFVFAIGTTKPSIIILRRCMHKWMGYVFIFEIPSMASLGRPTITGSQLFDCPTHGIPSRNVVRWYALTFKRHLHAWRTKMGKMIRPGYVKTDWHDRTICSLQHPRPPRARNTTLVYDMVMSHIWIQDKIYIIQLIQYSTTGKLSRAETIHTSEGDFGSDFAIWMMRSLVCEVPLGCTQRSEASIDWNYCAMNLCYRKRLPSQRLVLTPGERA